MKIFFLTSAGIILFFYLTTYLPTQKRVEYLKNYKAKLKKEVKTFKGKNKILKAKIQAIHKDPFFLEKTMRERFHLRRPGETLVILPKENGDPVKRKLLKKGEN